MVNICPPEHKHAENTVCYNHHGCRCDECRTKKSERNSEDFRKLGRAGKVRGLSCPRCGFVSDRRALLCADCRSVLSVQEREMWAA
jgi:uncharacterized OB-fold protein